MAKIVTRRNQQEEMRRLHPLPAYSRQVGIEVAVPAGVGADGFNFTPVIRQGAWLLGVDFWAFGVNVGETIGGFISIAVGTEEPKTAEEIVTKWEPVMRYSGIKPMMYWWSVDRGHFHWNMKQFYDNRTTRFACNISNFHATIPWWAWVFFEISEG